MKKPSKNRRMSPWFGIPALIGLWGFIPRMMIKGGSMETHPHLSAMSLIVLGVFGASILWGMLMNWENNREYKRENR